MESEISFWNNRPIFGLIFPCTQFAFFSRFYFFVIADHNFEATIGLLTHYRVKCWSNKQPNMRYVKSWRCSKFVASFVGWEIFSYKEFPLKDEQHKQTLSKIQLLPYFQDVIKSSIRVFLFFRFFEWVSSFDQPRMRGSFLCSYY